MHFLQSCLVLLVLVASSHATHHYRQTRYGPMPKLIMLGESGYFSPMERKWNTYTPLFHSKPVRASLASHTRHRIEYKQVHIPKTSTDVPVVQITSRPTPVMFLFKSQSTNLKVNHRHFSTPGSFKQTSSEDPPTRLKHTIRKSVIQEIREIIAPKRKVTQTIAPVVEEIKTTVHTSDNKTQSEPVQPITPVVVPVQVPELLQVQPSAPIVEIKQNDKRETGNRTVTEPIELVTQFGDTIPAVRAVEQRQPKATLLFIVNRQAYILPQAVQLSRRV